MANTMQLKQRRLVDALDAWINEGHKPSSLTKNVTYTHNGENFLLGDAIYELLLSRKGPEDHLKQRVREHGISTMGIDEATKKERNKTRAKEQARKIRRGHTPVTWETSGSEFLAPKINSPRSSSQPVRPANRNSQITPPDQEITGPIR